MRSNVLRFFLVLALVAITQACHRKEFGGERCSAPAIKPCAGCKIRCMPNETPVCMPGKVEDGMCVQRSNCDCT